MIDIQNLEFRWRPADPLALRIPALTGSVQVLGQALEQLGRVERDHFRADHVGYIFQLFDLIPYLSIIDNVLLPSQSK